MLYYLITYQAFFIKLNLILRFDGPINVLIKIFRQKKIVQKVLKEMIKKNIMVKN